MMLNVGHIAKTYGVLPSYVREHATTYDLMIADVMNSWEEYQINRAQNKVDTQHIAQEDLITMMEKVRNGNKQTQK